MSVDAPGGTRDAPGGTRDAPGGTPQRRHNRLEILIAAPGEADEHIEVGAVLGADVREVGDRVRGLEGRDDAFGAGEEREPLERLRVGTRHVRDATTRCEVGVLWTDAGVIESR